MTGKAGKVMYYAALPHGSPQIRRVVVKETPKQFRVLKCDAIYGDGMMSSCYTGRRIAKPADKVLFETLEDAYERVGFLLGKRIKSLQDELQMAMRRQDQISILFLKEVRKRGAGHYE